MGPRGETLADFVSERIVAARDEQSGESLRLDPRRLRPTHSKQPRQNLRANDFSQPGAE
jgi:hypothetical protein